MPDTLIVGGGVIGLSLAWELVQHGQRVQVIDAGPLGREASWAGAGMLPPGNPAGASTPEAALRGASAQLWPTWHQSLRAASGIDAGYRVCGGWELRKANDNTALDDEVLQWKRELVRCESIDARELLRRLPGVNPEINAAYFLPDMAQVRNPWLLKSLQAACLSAGVTLTPFTPAVNWRLLGGKVMGVETPSGMLTAANVVVSAGSWSSSLTGLPAPPPVEPVHGQIVLLNQLPTPISSIVQMGKRYLVPRSDGRILIGATEERRGFQKQVSAGGISELLAFACDLLPVLRSAQIEQTWSGLRPYHAGGLPFLGCSAEYNNLFFATGHFRSGLQLSPITARLMRQLILKQAIDLPTVIGRSPSSTTGERNAPVRIESRAFFS